MRKFTSRNTLPSLQTSLAFLQSMVFAACCTGFLVQIPAQSVQQQELFPNTKAADAQGRDAADKIALQAALAQNPSDADTWYRFGLLEGQLHNFAAAEQDLRRSVALDPAVAETHYLLGLSLVANPRAKLDWPAAIAEFRAALKLRPEYADAFTYLGVGLTATGQNDEAVKALQNAVRIAPNSASAYFNLALALEPVMKDADAATAYRRAATLRPGFAEAHSALGKLLFRTGELDSAERELHEALGLSPDLQDAHYALGQVLRAQHRLQDARVEFDIALTLGQREPDGITSSQRSNAAMREAAAGTLPAAERMLREAIVLRPDYGVPHYNLGLILADSGRWDAAISQLSQAASLMPAQAGPWFDLGRVLRRQGHNDEALACLRWAAALAPGERTLAELREVSTALHTSVPATATQPSFGVGAETPEAFRAYAGRLLAGGDLQGAVGMLLHALALAPAAVGPRVALAEAYRQSGDSVRALQEYRKALAVEPHNPAALAIVQPKPKSAAPAAQ